MTFRDILSVGLGSFAVAASTYALLWAVPLLAAILGNA